MTFPYVESLLITPDTGDAISMFRPEIWVQLHGPDGDTCTVSVLVDTGADHSILPEWVAVALNVPTQPCLGPASTGISGSGLSLQHGVVEFEINDGSESHRWETTAFFRFGAVNDDSAVVGNMGFLEFFTATFDGGNYVLTLEPNMHLPRTN